MSAISSHIWQADTWPRWPDVRKAFGYFGHFGSIVSGHTHAGPSQSAFERFISPSNNPQFSLGTMITIRICSFSLEVFGKSWKVLCFWVLKHCSRFKLNCNCISRIAERWINCPFRWLSGKLVWFHVYEIVKLLIHIWTLSLLICFLGHSGSMWWSTKNLESRQPFLWLLAYWMYGASTHIFVIKEPALNEKCYSSCILSLELFLVPSFD